MGMAAALPQQPADRSRRARVRLDARGRRHRRDRHDRHRHRQLHDHRADRGRDDGRAARQGRGAASATSTFPVSAGSGGQWGANSSTAGVYAACVKLREAVAQKLGFNSATRRSRTAQVALGDRSAAAGRGRRRGGLVAEDAIEYRRPRQEVPAIDLRRAFRRSRRRRRDRRDRASGACSRSARPAASSIRSRRAAR